MTSDQHPKKIMICGSFTGKQGQGFLKIYEPKKGNRPVMPLMTRDKTGTSRDKTGTSRDKTETSRDKTGTAGTKQGQEGQAGTKQEHSGIAGEKRDSRDNTGTSRDKSGTVMGKSLKTKVLNYFRLSLFSPFLVCPCFSLLICRFLSLFFPCSVFAGFVPVLSLFF